jgi:CRP-like cAMP-binding protein
MTAPAAMIAGRGFSFPAALLRQGLDDDDPGPVPDAISSPRWGKTMGEDLLDVIRNIHFLHDFPDAYLEPLATVASIKECAPGVVVFREGQKESRLYLVVKGAVSLEYCTPGMGCKRLQTVGTGELLGWSPVLGLSDMTATARVLEATRLLVLDARQLVTLCEHNPRFGYEFMRRTALALSQRLSATRLQLLDVYHQELPVVPEEREV